MKLNRWQRIGVVFAILWALGAAWYERNSEMERGRHFLDLSFQACREIEKSTSETCLAERSKDYELWMKPNWGNLGFIAFVPIILGWILAFIIIRVYQWIKAGEL